ncbi:FtsK/SpoIIIE domain-containing protein [Arthrobacter sp. H16F315]|uniref:FtsK/SpoIIIE domain-containing protein n=1 Tax=Arthrobacter sp. H16F315 TaxID=2955314 RepID=UPI0020982A5E|nr:FtsK/SpoIIIE domain-containing protein [Arthrobacter sp. H16F315]MDD1477037.1 FtsK/SpoIIIE domain-containing protein [Arthrobacter sp. H16F315]
MLLHCTLVPAPGSALTSGPVELAIELPASCPGADLEAAIARRYGTGALTVDRVPVAALTSGKVPLVAGAVLVDGAAPPTIEDPATLVLTVHSGPGAGLIFPLRRGRFRIGRSGTEIVIPDAELSREHARLDVTDSAVSLVDLGSANGVRVDGRKVQAAPVSTGSAIRCGGSSMSLVFGDTLDAGIPASAGSDISAPLVLSNPAAHSNRAALLLAAGLPLCLGVGLAVLTGMWVFLAFTALSAVSILVPVFSGRRQRRELRAAVAAAARQDSDRRRRAAPSAGELSLGARFLAADRGVSSAIATGPVWLRLGQAPQRANIGLEPPDSGFQPPLLGLVPVTLNPATRLTTVRGPETAVSGLVRSCLLQLASYPAAGRTRILVHGPTPSLYAARFLPAVVLSAQETSTLEILATGPGPGYERGVLVIVTTMGRDRLCSAAERHGWQVFHCAEGPATAAAGSVLELTERTAVLSSGHSAVEFIPDLVPAGVFDRACRRLGGQIPEQAPPKGLPDACYMAGLMQASAAEISARWASSANAPGLPVLVGVGTSGPLWLDLQTDGPHFLVAGTTGSGKSELLRTLAVGLVGHYPPDRVNLLFIDFKGGSGLRPLAALSHCVGLLTDLDQGEVARTLVSLRAEVRHREELLDAYRAADLIAYESLQPAAPPLPHLVLIIDEFRMLVDEAPEALAELMRVAAIGRSLGIHLIMATQRPQGAVSADIRANVTSRVALRVQSELESLDIINSRLAAAIPIARPGRAYLVRGSEAPEEFQTATTTPPPSEADGWPTVMEVREFLNRAAVEPSAARAASPPSLAITHLTETVRAAWAASGGTEPRRPVAAPLPGKVPFPTDGSRGRIRLGLLDLPREQRVAEFGWHPGTHGHLGLIPGLNGGADAVLELIVNQLLGCDDESHMYLLDATGSFSAMSTAARVGAVVGLHELRRAARVLERVSEEMNRRLGLAHPADLPVLVLVLCGWGSWVSAFRAGPLAWAEDLVHNIVRDGGRVGIAVLAAGERELVTARFFAAVPNRIFLPAGLTEEARFAWPRLPAGGTAGDRVVVFGPMSVSPSPSGHVGQLFGPRPPAVGGEACLSRIRPFRIEPLPPRVTVSEVHARSGPAGAGSSGATHRPGPAASSGQLCLGVQGDELCAVGIPLPPGAVLAVLGGHLSGKSSLLSALPGLNPTATWLRPPSATDLEGYWAGTYDAALAGALDPAAVLLADDLDLQSAETNRRLVLLNNLGWRVVLTAGFNPAIRQRVPLTQNAAGYGRGVLLAPRSVLDGDLFGVRFDLEPSPPPGRAVLISEGRARAVQLAFDPAADSRRDPTGPG